MHYLYLKSARDTFSFSKEWLPEQKFEDIIHELASIALRRSRISALAATEGFTRPKKHPISGYEYGVQASLSIGRYSTSLDTHFQRLMTQIFPSQSDDTNP